jgi:SpoVK/Ycf46/Vps4 family AAA+-type ATPase
VVAVVQEAAMLAVDSNSDVLLKQHLTTAIKSITPQITLKMIEFYKDMARKYS